MWNILVEQLFAGSWKHLSGAGTLKRTKPKPLFTINTVDSLNRKGYTLVTGLGTQLYAARSLGNQLRLSQYCNCRHFHSFSFITLLEAGFHFTAAKNNFSSMF